MEIGDLFNPKGLFVGSFIPDAVSKLTSITPTDKLVYGRLMRYAGEDGQCYPKQSEIAIECGVSLSAVTKSIANLLDAKLLVVVAPTGIERIKHFRNKYFFAWHKIFENCKLRTSKIYLSEDVNFTCASKRVRVKENHIKPIKPFSAENPILCNQKSFTVFNKMISHAVKTRSEAIAAYYFEKFESVNGKKHSSVLDEQMIKGLSVIEKYMVQQDYDDERIVEIINDFFRSKVLKQSGADFCWNLFTSEKVLKARCREREETDEI